MQNTKGWSVSKLCNEISNLITDWENQNPTEEKGLSYYIAPDYTLVKQDGTWDHGCWTRQHLALSAGKTIYEA